MATLGNNVFTLSDLAKRLDPQGKVAKIVEALNETNEILDDMMWREGNLPTGHRTTIRTGLPGVTWRVLNYGVQPSTSKTKQVTDACGMLAGISEIDKALVDLDNNTAELRASEDRTFLESMNQELAKTLFYGDTRDYPERFVGLAPRFSDPTADVGENMLNGGGTGSDNTSVWLVVWGDQSSYGIIPKGSKAGWQHKDYGEVMLEDDSGGKYPGYRSWFQWDAGLTVKDWRYVVRICNIDVSALTKDASAGADLIDLMVQALEMPPGLKAGRPAFYCNKTIRSFLRRQIRNDGNVNLTLDNVEGKRVLAFDEVPVRRCDQILNTEAAITGF